MAEPFDPYYTWLGIPPEEQPADYYRLLGVRRYETNTDVINNAADQRMAHIRTFQSGKRSTESQKVLNELAAAVVCLANPQKRAAYDQTLRAQEAAQRAQQAAPAYVPPPMPPAWSAPPPVAHPMAAVQPIPLAQPMPVAQAMPVARAMPVPVAAAAHPASEEPAAGPVAVRSRRRSIKSNGMLVPGLVVAALLVVAGGVWVMNQGPEKPDVGHVNPTPKPPNPAPPPRPATTPEATGETTSSAKASTETTTQTPATGTTESSPTSAAPQGEERTEWRYHVASRGTFKKTDEGWVFARPGKPDELWEETSRTDKYVEIKDPKAGRLMRLQADRFTTSLDGKAWSGNAAGGWVAKAPSPETKTNVSSQATVGSKLSAEFLAQAPKNAKPFDVLPAIVPASAQVSGVVERKGAGLHFAGNEQWPLAKLKLPVRPPPAYILEVEFTPTNRGTGMLGIGLVLDGKQCTLQLDSFPKFGNVSGLEIVDGKRVPELTEPLVVKGQQVKLNERNHIAVLVQSGRIWADLNGKRITTWEGNAAELTQAMEHALPDMSLGLTTVRGDMTIHSLKIMPLAATVATTNTTATTSSSGSDTSQPMSTPSAMVAETKKRLPVPMEEELEAARQRLKSVFGNDVTKAVKPPEKLALAKRLVDAAKNEESPSVKYVVLQAARRLAVGGNDATLSLSIATSLSDAFEVDNVTLLTETIGDLSKADLPTSEQDKVTDTAMKAAREALENEQADAADSLSQVALTFANRTKDPARRKSAKAMRDEAVRFKEAFQQYQAAKDLLAVDENDARSNLAVGKFLCFERQDWIQGREYLAKGGDDKLSSAAKVEAAATTARELLAAADAWFEQRSSFSGREKTRLERHAADLYELAAPNLAGLDRSKADNRLAELKSVLITADKAATEAGVVETMSKKGPIRYIQGIVVRAFVTNQGADIPTPYICAIKDYSQLPDDEIRQLVIDNYRRSPTYLGVGYLVLDADTDVSIRIDACTCRIGSELLSALSGTLQQYQRSYKKGTHTVLFSLKDTNGRPYFALTDAKTGKNLLYYNEKEWLDQQRKSVPVPGGGSVQSQVMQPR